VRFHSGSVRSLLLAGRKLRVNYASKARHHGQVYDRYAEELVGEHR
jgi:hypothetical protein